LGRRPAFPHAQ